MSVNIATLEDFYSALILGGCTEKNEQLFITIPTDRVKMLHYYQDFFNLGNSFNYTEINHQDSEYITLSFQKSLIYHRMKNEWSYSDSIIHAIPPKQLTINLVMLWVALFGEKRKNYIYLKSSNFSNDARETFAYLFTVKTDIDLPNNHQYFSLNDVKAFTLLAIRCQRPTYELVLLTRLLSIKEHEKLLNILKRDNYQNSIQRSISNAF